jgi:hypothetical protein
MANVVHPIESVLHPTDNVTQPTNNVTHPIENGEEMLDLDPHSAIVPGDDIHTATIFAYKWNIIKQVN